MDPSTTPRHGYADLDDVRLHYVEAGHGPLVILLHGFPEFWYSWRHQIAALAGAGFRVVAPDMRGYNLSSKPREIWQYTSDKLATDVSALIHERGERRAHLAGHDWGGNVAWFTAMNHPEQVERLAILNVPHPRRMMQGITHPAQLLRSWYIFFFQLPWLPETVVFRLRPFGARLQRELGSQRFNLDDLAEYERAWSQAGAPSAMINYYRASIRRRRSAAATHIRPVHAETLVIWGQRDAYLREQLAEPMRSDVPNLREVVRLPQVSHWVQQHAPEQVSQLLIDFFQGAQLRRSSERMQGQP